MPTDLEAIASVLVIMTTLGIAMIFGCFFSLDADRQQALTRRALRSASYFLPNAFTDGALGVASDCLHAPSLCKLVVMSPGQVAATLGLGSKEHARKVIDSLVKVLHDEFSPAEIYVGGSFKKNTALKSRSDIDLVMKLNNFLVGSLAEYYKRAVNTLRQAFGPNIEVVSKPCSPYYVLSFFVAKGLQFDLVFACLPAAPNVEHKFRSGSTSYLADEAIKSFGDSNTLFRPLALLCKHWAYEIELQNASRPKSYFVELFVMETIRQVGNDCSIQEGFLFFLMLISGRKALGSVRNLNPNAMPKTVSLKHWKVFASLALETWSLVFHLAKSGSMTMRSLIREDVEYHPTTETTAWVATADLNDVDAPRQSCLVENQAHNATLLDCPQDMHLYFHCLEQHPNDILQGDHRFVWQGDHRFVCKGVYDDGERQGQACVVKWFKSGDVYEERFYQGELRTVRQVAKIIDSFNSLLRVRSPLLPYKVLVNSPGVWTVSRTGHKRLVEPYLDCFIKFNSNTGQINEDFRVMQALSHFSYHISDGECLLCDVQGQPPGDFGRTYTLTDPVICSKDKLYGPTDLGMQGMENFFYYHKCNSYCRRDWKKARAVQHFRPSWGSLMA